MKLIIINVNALHSNEITLGASLSLGCIIGFFAGGWISQYLGKRTMMVLSNFASFLIWLMLAFGTNRVSFIIIERFSMGVFSAAAVGCVGELHYVTYKADLPDMAYQNLYHSRYLHLGDITLKIKKDPCHLPNIGDDARQLVGLHCGCSF